MVFPGMSKVLADGINFSNAVTNEVAVDSTTQQLLFTGSGAVQVVVISNPSINRALWIKPDDNTVNKRGILLPPGESEPFPVGSNIAVFGIMDAGPSTDISIVRFS